MRKANLLTPKRELTCGLIVSSPAGWLLGHATGTPFWDLPKGQREPGEDPLDAALRECWEEMGLDMSSYRDQFLYLGKDRYNKKLGKTLALFSLRLPAPLDLSSCACQTLVATRGADPVPDMDDFAWVPHDRVERHLKPRMFKHLSRRGLVAPHPRPTRELPIALRQEVAASRD